MVITNGSVANADEVIEMSGRVAAQNTNRILKADTSVFVNEDYSGADTFSVDVGAMNTVDTTTTTSEWAKGGFYALAVVDEASGDATNDPDSFSNPGNAFDEDSETWAEKIAFQYSFTYYFGKTFSSKYVGAVRIDCNIDYPTVNGSTLYLQTYNGSTWSTVTTLDTSASGTASFDGTYFLDATTQGVRIKGTGSHPNDGFEIGLRINILAYGADYESDAILKTNSIISDNVPDSIVVYGETDLPTDTSITVDVSDDGGSTWDLTDKELNTAIDTSSFSTGNLALKFNLATTDTSVTPKLYGYGVAIIDT